MINEEKSKLLGSQLLYQTLGNCDVKIPGPCGLVIFGASGDLTKRKIVPALYRLHGHRLLPRNFFVLGTSRGKMDTEGFRDLMLKAVKDALPEDFDNSSWQEFVSRLYFVPIHYEEKESYLVSLKTMLHDLEKRYQTGESRVFYLAIPPTVFEDVILNLGETGMAREARGMTHVVIEKPFGRDIDSARKLNGILRRSFEEKQIYRIDHFLGMETVQNILMCRFANFIFEPLWNNRYLDHVQITASETLGVEHRAGYYEEAGVIRDMFQNHMLQLLALAAMEPPVAFEADPVRDEKVKVLRSVRPFPLDRLDECLVIGQYGEGKGADSQVIGYRQEPGVSPGSTTPTFAAMKVWIDNWRWNGVPFYLRSGKRMTSRKTEISIHFKPVPHLMFSKTLNASIDPDTLIFRIHPDEGMNLIIQAKRPGSKVCLRTVPMVFSFQRGVLMDAYEWVLLDCMHGDHMIFVRQDAVEQAWELFTPVIKKLEATTRAEAFPNYAAGSAGPEEAALLIEKDGRTWRPL